MADREKMVEQIILTAKQLCASYICHPYRCRVCMMKWHALQNALEKLALFQSNEPAAPQSVEGKEKPNYSAGLGGD